MVERAVLRDMARDCIRDAEVLFDGGRYRGAIYICGYAVELSLKYRICKTLKWKHFMPSGLDSNISRGLKTHDLEALRKVSGVEEKIQKEFLSAWLIVKKWNPTMRYEPNITASKKSASDMIESTRRMMEATR